MRPPDPFPLEDWHRFQSLHRVEPLLEDVPFLRDIADWPSPKEWQEAAESKQIWEAIDQQLSFTPEIKLGQRAKRKQKDAPPGRSYEASIVEKSEIPTRIANLHDFFNALIWINFPLGKYHLHRRAYEIQTAWWQTHDRQKRCPLLDRMTCFDEGGIVFDLPENLERGPVEALIQSRDDEAKKLLVECYAERFSFFGHGMMEVMMKGKSNIHAACIILDPGPESLDYRLSAYLKAFGEQTADHGAVNVSWFSAQ
ncbi:MAG: DUF3025 domain-containing protein [Proteobacteria bacterium]|nr:MAG: DUF3025 domain-containing protein [Pseudomonadota bacterium]